MGFGFKKNISGKSMEMQEKHEQSELEQGGSDGRSLSGDAS
jgi:hypothetical protein